MMKLQKKSLAELLQVRALGRHVGRDPLTLFWTASGIELAFTGTELWVDFYADFEWMQPWISVEIDGAWIARMPVNPGESRVCLFRGMTEGTVKHVRLMKEVQAMAEDPKHLLQITGLEYADGEFRALPEPALRLEFVGDSITSGVGAIGSVSEVEDEIADFYSAVNNYSRMTADALHAEFRCISQSGWGIVSDWKNDVRNVMPAVYTEVSGVSTGAQNVMAGAQEENDFASWQPDVVIINLGTNEQVAFDKPAWTIPETGVQHKLRRLENGDFHPEDVEWIARGVRDFLVLLREKNPGAKLVWCIGMMGNEILPVIQRGVTLYKERSSDENCFLLELPDTTADTMGALQHPGVKSHQRAAEVLTRFLSSILRIS